MRRNPRYDILFEPVRIGPKTAKNRFYQVPHCTGMGFDLPHSVARLREIKAEGGWAVVNTEYCSMHWSSDDGPYAFCSLWDENDVRIQGMTVEKIHGYDALAGVELWHGGNHAPNRASRACTPPLDPCPCSTSMPSFCASARTRNGVVTSPQPSVRGIGK